MFPKKRLKKTKRTTGTTRTAIQRAINKEKQFAAIFQKKNDEQKSEKAIVVVAHIYRPVTGQRQTLIYWTIRTLFIAVTTL